MAGKKNFFMIGVTLILLFTNISAYDPINEIPIETPDFLKDFKYGILGVGVDCEQIKFLSDGTFAYKFTGDCKGWGRVLKGTWKKKENRLILSAVLIESKEEGDIGCAGSYYHKNTPKEKADCFSAYKKDILKNFGVFPAKFDLQGEIWITTKLAVAVKLESYLTNNPKKGRIKGLMHFSDEEFGKFYRE